MRWSILAVLILASGCARCPQSHEAPPLEVFTILEAERRPVEGLRIASTSNEMHNVAEASVGGTRFLVCTDRRSGTAEEVATEDSTFVTPDGVHVGMTLRETLRRCGEEPVTVPGFAHTVRLRSGWTATFTTPGANGPTDGELHQSSRIKWLFFELPESVPTEKAPVEATRAFLSSVES